MMTRADRETDANTEALRRWLTGQDAALDEWLDGRVRPIRRKPRALATA